MHEIITLQLGQKANYLATHFWNTQESYFTYSGNEESPVDHDVHFRPGIGADGTETFTPRTVIYDLKGGFGTLRKINALYELEEDRAPQAGVWQGAPAIRPQPAIEPSAYQVALENGTQPPPLTKDAVRYWSDFNRVYFHPKSIVQLNEYELNSALMPFENWSTGEELFNGLDKEHDLLDRDLRPFAEEADQMQGIQIMASMDDAWGGFAAKYMDRLRDEYGKIPIWIWGLEDSLGNTPRAKQFLKQSNTARSISEISSQASVYIPMSLPSRSLPAYLNLDPASQWHTSALFSTALETMALPSRFKFHNGKRESLDELAAAINTNGNQRIAKLQMSVKNQEAQTNGDSAVKNTDSRMRARDGQQSTGDGDDDEAPLDIDFFPSTQASNVRGPRSANKVHLFGRVESMRGDDHDISQEQDDFDGQERARRRAAGLSIIHKNATTLPYPILDSFPNIYDLTSESSKLSVRTALSTDTGISTRIKNLKTLVGRGFGLDERENLCNSLGEIAEQYEEGWDSGSDEDDD